MLPNLFLLAAPRSGSTQMAAWMASHPDIGLPPIKEPNYFSQHEFPEEFVERNRLNDVVPERYVSTRSKKQMQFAIFRDQAHYGYLFEDLKERWRLDASTSYLHCPEAPAAIHKLIPDAKIIILTRDPVARAISHYRLALRIGQTTRTLREEIEAELDGTTPLPGRFLLRPSRHADAVERCRSVFSEDQRLELSFEDMIADVDATLAKVAEFLDVSVGGFDTAIERQNKGDSPRFKALNVWLLRSGVKTYLRRILPTGAKQALKTIYFKPSTEVFSEDDRALLREHLGV